MPQRTVTIASRVGLHARPASLFTQAVAESGVAVTITKDGRPPVDASSMLRVMALGAKHGEEVTLAAEGDGAEPVLDRLVDLLASDLDDEPGS